MGMDEKLKNRMVPQYKPRANEKAEDGRRSVFNNSYLEHHNIVTLRWKNGQNVKEEGESDDG